MITIAKNSRRAAQDRWQVAFLVLLPEIKRYARFAFCSLRREERQDAVTEVIANAVCAYRRLVELGKQELAYASVLARFAVAQYRAGRRVGKVMNSNDVLGDGRRRHRVRVVSLAEADATGERWSESLADNTRSPIPDQAAFRIDFATWLDRQTRRDRKLAEFLAMGNTPSEAAQRFRISLGRVSQVLRSCERTGERFMAS